MAAGDGRFLDDLGHDALAAAFLRSPHAHARVLDVDVSAAVEVDGLVAIYTYEDLDGRMAEPLPLLIPHPDLRAPRTAYPLANGIVRHVGEAVVHRAHRGRGLGSRLLTAAVERMRAMGLREIYIERHEDNEGSAGMMRKAGFEVIDVYDDPRRRVVGSGRTSVSRLLAQD